MSNRAPSRILQMRYKTEAVTVSIKFFEIRLDKLLVVAKLEMRTFWGRKGKPITLPCTLPVPDDTNFSLEWRKENKLIMSAYGSEAGHAAPSLQVTNIIEY
ncbi:hypothetical protein OSTOST_01005 [Ostertagia ostertagi]